MSASMPILQAVSAREQMQAIVKRWRRDLPAAEVRSRAAALAAAIRGDIALGADPADGLEALAVLQEAGL